MSSSGEPEETGDDLVGPQNHFCWDLESLMDWKDVSKFLEDRRKRFSFLRPHKTLKRFRLGLLMAYIMFTHDLEGWSNCLDNAILLMDHTRHPTSGTPLMNLPPFENPLWKGPFEDFLAYIPDSEEQTGIDAHNVGEQEADWNSFEGLYIPAEHIAFSLKATMLTKIRALNSAGDLWERIVPIDEMSDAEKAGIYYIKAATFRFCGTQGLAGSIEPLSKAVLLDSENLRWTLKLIQYKGWVRNTYCGGKATWADVENTIAAVDSNLKLELEPWMKVEFQYEKFQAIQEFLKDPQNRYSLPADKRYEFYYECEKLSEAIVATTKKSRMLSHCALFYARDQKGVDRAVEIIAEVLRNNPVDVFINSKAVTIYYKANQFDKALNCAKIAAEKSLGSYMQLLQLKTKMGHSFDLEEFFLKGLNKYQQMTEVRTIHINAFTHYSALTNRLKRAIWHFKKLLDSEPPEEFYRIYSVYINSMIHTGEAAYNVILYVMSDDKTYSDEEYDEDNDLEMFIQVKEDIEARFDVESFRSKRQTPKEYLEWLKTTKDPKFKCRFTGTPSRSLKPETQEWVRQKSNPRSEHFNKQRVDQSHNRGGSFGSSWNRRENQTDRDFGPIASHSRASTHQESSPSRDWRSRPFTSNTSYSNSSSNSRHSSVFENWRFRDGGSGPKSSDHSQIGRSQSNWRARDDTSHDP